MTRALGLVVLLAAVPVLAGYAGRLHAAGDSLAVFRPQAAVLLAALGALALVRRPLRRVAMAGLAVALFALVPVVWQRVAPAPVGGDLRLYQKNMLFRNDRLDALLADIVQAAPDVVTLQEVSKANLALLKGLEPDLPTQLHCPFARVGGTAIATRFPAVPDSAVCAEGLAALKVTGPQGALWLVSVHLHWPWPYGQQAQVARLLPVIEEMEAPVVMAGDFNMVPWADAVSALRGVTGTANAGPLFGTYTGFAPWLRLPIDHVLAPGGGRVEGRGNLGSDHVGLLAEVSLHPPG